MCDGLCDGGICLILEELSFLSTMSRSRVELGALICGITFSIATGLLCLAFIGLAVFFALMTNDGGLSESYHYTQNEVALYLIHLVFVFVPSLVCFIFSVLLACGVGKKKPKLVLAYFIFGVFAIVFSVVGAGICIPFDPFGTGYTAIIWFALILLYIPVMVLVWKAYTKLRSDAEYHYCEQSDT